MNTVKESYAGDLLHVCIYHRCSRWDSKKKKEVSKKDRETAYRLINMRNSAQKLEELYLCNFDMNDYHVVFKLAPAYKTNDYKKLKKYWDSFINRVRKLRKRRGAEPLKYLYVMEGLHGNKSLHIHAILKAEQLDSEGWAEIIRCWQYGQPTSPPYEVEIKNWEHKNHVGIYLSKEPKDFGRKKVGQRIFNASHNLEKPTRYTYNIAEATEYTIPDGYILRHNSSKESDYGNFHFLILTKIGADVSMECWEPVASTFLK